MPAAATVESTLYTDPNAAGFLSKAAFGATILPFTYTFAVIDTDFAADTIKLAPLVARGGRNRLIAVVFYGSDVDESTGLDMDLTVYQEGAHTIIWNAGAAWQSAVGTAIAPVIIIPLLALKDTDAADADGIADLCLYVNTAATTGATGTITGFAIYE